MLFLLRRSWSERLREAERCKNAEVNLLRRRGVALALDGRQLSEQPCPFLVNLTPDPSLSGALLYLLPPGPVRVGRVDSSQGVVASPCTPGRSPMPNGAGSGSVGASPVLGRSPSKTPSRSPPLAPHIQLEGPLVQKHHWYVTCTYFLWYFGTCCRMGESVRVCRAACTTHALHGALLGGGEDEDDQDKWRGRGVLVLRKDKN